MDVYFNGCGTGIGNAVRFFLAHRCCRRNGQCRSQWPQGRFLQVNIALCELVGRSEEEMLDLGFQQISHADDIEASVLGWKRMLAGELDLFQIEKRITPDPAKNKITLLKWERGSSFAAPLGG